jgi:hypothetical protein
MVVFGIVADDDHTVMGSDAAAPQFPHEVPEGDCVESIGLPTENELSVPQPHRAGVSHAASRRVMQQYRILGLWRYPHLAARAVLLKMHFVGGPQIHSGVSHQRLECFLCSF